MKEDSRILRFFVVSVLFNIAANCVHPVTPTLIKERGFGDYIFGIALAAALTTNFLFSPFWAKLATHISSRKVILVCNFGYAIGQAMFGMARTETALVVARLVAGTFLSGGFTASLTYLVNTSPERMRGSYLTVAATIGTVASAFGYFVGGMLGEIGVSWAIIAQVVMLCASAVLFYIVCRDDRPGGGEELHFRTLVREANPLAAFLAGRAFMTPLFIAVFSVAALSNLGSTAFDQSFNYYLKAQLGLTSGYNGAIKALIGLVSLAANSTLGLWLINRSEVRRSSIYIYLLCSLSMLGVVFLSATVPFVAVNVIYFGLFSISVPLTQSLVAGHAKRPDSNLVFGYYNGLKSVGGIFGALFAGLLYTANPKWPFLLGFGAFFLATVASIYYNKLSRRDEAQSLGRGGSANEVLP